MWVFSITPQSWFNNRFSWGLKHLLVTNIRNCVFVALISWFQISDTVSARNRPTSPSAVDFVSANYKNFDPPRWAYFLHNSVLTPDFLTKITSNFGFEKFSSPKLFVTKIMSSNFGQEGPGRHGLCRYGTLKPRFELRESLVLHKVFYYRSNCFNKFTLNKIWRLYLNWPKRNKFNQNRNHGRGANCRIIW